MEIYCCGSTKAVRYAAEYLHNAGISICTAPSHNTTHLLLDAPAFSAEGLLRSGKDIQALLSVLPDHITVCGGNLDHPGLVGYKRIDLLKDAEYLAQNAYITAECALDVALPYLTVTLRDCPVLIIGWGRIGKCLGLLLKNIGADVTIAARKESDRAMIRSFGIKALSIDELTTALPKYRLLYNTVPELILHREQMQNCRADCIKIDLASKQGIQDEDAVIARGLPGIHFPESSGSLIAQTLLRLFSKEEIL